MPRQVRANHHPNFTLHRLVDRVRPHECEIQAVRDRFGEIRRRLAQAFPGTRMVPIGSHSRGTAIAVHSSVDFLAVLPPEWATWGARRVSPLTIMRRMTENLADAFATEVRPDGRAVELYFKGVTFSVDVVPGFVMRDVEHYPVYLVPGEENRWIEASPERHTALFARANARCDAKLRSISQLVRTWQRAGSPSLGISGFYVDMMLATSDIAWGVKSYGQCLNDFFAELVRREMRGLLDPVGVSGVIVANSSSAGLERLYHAVKAAHELSQAALDAQGQGDNAEANGRWKALFKRAL